MVICKHLGLQVHMKLQKYCILHSLLYYTSNGRLVLHMCNPLPIEINYELLPYDLTACKNLRT